ncbi:CatB-related O-acetyltransferase [Hymenobacter coalescens]
MGNISKAHGPDPELVHPLPGQTRLVFLKNIVDDPRIEVGDYTYYDDFDDPRNFLRNVLYHFPFSTDRLRIGRFCMLASGVKFVMNGGNHRTDLLSTYPFPIFGHGWETAFDAASWPHKGDTTIGHDVWIGYEALVMPGVTVGNGAIIATRSVVTKDVPAFAVVAGNPAAVVRMRFDADTVARLEQLAWWDWDAAKITRNLPAICARDLAALERAQ